MLTSFLFFGSREAILMSSEVICVDFSNRFQLGGVRVGTLNNECRKELNKKVFLRNSVAWGIIACSVMGNVNGDKSLFLIYAFIELLSGDSLGSSSKEAFVESISIYSVDMAWKK